MRVLWPSLPRLERGLEDVREDLSAARASLSETETSRNEATAAAAEASARLQTSEEQLLRSRREHDLLQAERSVWQVARSGIQEELAKVREKYCGVCVCVRAWLCVFSSLASPALTGYRWTDVSLHGDISKPKYRRRAKIRKMGEAHKNETQRKCHLYTTSYPRQCVCVCVCVCVIFSGMCGAVRCLESEKSSRLQSSFFVVFFTHRTR